MAKAEAANWGLSNARFEMKDVSMIEGKTDCDLVTAFDTVHDQAKPAVLLQQVASALKRGGTFLMWDVAASSDLHKNKEHPLAARGRNSLFRSNQMSQV